MTTLPQPSEGSGLQAHTQAPIPLMFRAQFLFMSQEF